MGGGGRGGTASRDRVNKARLLLFLPPPLFPHVVFPPKISLSLSILLCRARAEGESGGSSKIAPAGNFLRKTHRLLFATAFGIFSITAKRKFLPSSPLLSFPKNSHGRIFVIGKRGEGKRLTADVSPSQGRSHTFFYPSRDLETNFVSLLLQYCPLPVPRPICRAVQLLCPTLELFLP